MCLRVLVHDAVNPKRTTGAYCDFKVQEGCDMVQLNFAPSHAMHRSWCLVEAERTAGAAILH
jgi:hypothetical protein